MYSHAATISPALFLSFYYLLYCIGLAGTYMMYNNVYYVIVSVLYYNDTSTVDMFLFLPGYSYSHVGAFRKTVLLHNQACTQ